VHFYVVFRRNRRLSSQWLHKYASYFFYASDEDVALRVVCWELMERKKNATMGINHNDWRIRLLHAINHDKIELVHTFTFDVRLINSGKGKNRTDHLARAKCKHY
jgi:hypothetical protein